MASLETIERPALRPLPERRLRRWLLSRTGRKTREFYLFLAPFLLGLLALTVFPVLFGFYISLTNYDGLNLDTVKFVGARNYLRTFADPQALGAAQSTAIWIAVNTPLFLSVALLVALLLNQIGKGSSMFRVLFYLPAVVPVAVAITLWKSFMDANSGLFNYLLSLFEPGTTVRWLSDHSFPSLSAIALWGGLGGGVVVFLAGLQSIPDEVQEAARIDGANGWQVFRYVTFPLLTPVIFFMLVNSLIVGLQAFLMPLIAYNVGAGTDAAKGVAPQPVYFYMLHVWTEIMRNQRFGYGTAMLWLFTLLSVALILFVFRTSHLWVHYEVEVDEERSE